MHLVDCDQCRNELLEYPTISEALAENRILKITKLDDGRVVAAGVLVKLLTLKNDIKFLDTQWLYDAGKLK